MLIDGGNEADSSLIIKYIKRLGISKIDYIIATHPDSDHIAGLDKIILAFDIGCVYMPITNKSNKETDELYNAIKDKKVINSTINDYFYLGNSKCIILNSGDTSKASDNNSHIFSFLFISLSLSLSLYNVFLCYFIFKKSVFLFIYYAIIIWNTL